MGNDNISLNECTTSSWGLIELNNSWATHRGFGGSLANNVPSLRPLSFLSSGSESESDESMGSSGLTGVVLLLLFELGVVDCCFDDGALGRLFLGGASGCGAGVGC